jgi:hypothetical protein
MVPAVMEARICYCCGGKLDEMSPENPNVCVSCVQWSFALEVRVPGVEARIVDLVPVDDDGIAPGSPSWN